MWFQEMKMHAILLSWFYLCPLLTAQAHCICCLCEKSLCRMTALLGNSPNIFVRFAFNLCGKNAFSTLLFRFGFIRALFYAFFRNKTHKCTKLLLTNKWLTIDFVVTKQTIWFSTVEMFSFKKKNVNLKCTCQFTNLVLLLWCNNGLLSSVVFS